MDLHTQIEAAAIRIAAHVRHTPCMPLDRGNGAPAVTLKLEHLQHTGSFKVRGAFNSLLALETPPKAGVVAASGGNHGAAIAYAATKLGLPARIFVPEGTPAAKASLIARIGGEVVVAGSRYAEAAEAAQAEAEATGALQIHAYDAPMTVAGQGTMMREWEAQAPDLDTVLIAVGGGGLIGGAMAWLQGRRKVVAVEPEGCNTLENALRNGPEAEIAPQGIARSALGGSRIGQICYHIAQAHPPEPVLVTDDAIRKAQIYLWRQMRQLVEPGGATALAALLSGAYRPAPGERVGVLVCGANTDPDPFA